MARHVVERQPAADEARVRLDDGVRVVEVDAVAPIANASSGANRRTVTSGRDPARGIERDRVRDDAQPAQRLKHGHAGPPDRRTASA